MSNYNNLPATIHKNKKITVSADGSIMFYSLEYNEAYRAKSVGAFTESYHKFINASRILERAKTQDVRVLDMCFGLGYNCATTLTYVIKNKISNRVHIVSIEKDAHLLELVKSLKILWPLEGYNLIRELLNNRCSSVYPNITIEMHVQDALDVLKNLTGKFDAIYFDPFSISKNPEMWSVEVFTKMYELLDDCGALVTYACGKTARGNMKAAGLKVEEVPTARGAFHPGTRATKY